MNKNFKAVLTDLEWRSTVRDRIAEKFSKAKCNAAIAVWSDFCGNIDLQTLLYLQSLIPKGPLMLLTNATDRLEEDLKKAGIFSKFSQIFNSSTIGMAKPSADLFKHVADRIGLRPKEVIFIDDSKQNVAAAGEMGFAAVHFVGLSNLQEQLDKIL